MRKVLCVMEGESYVLWWVCSYIVSVVVIDEEFEVV